MTHLEDRLRQELQELSKRVGPASLRPLADPPARARARVRRRRRLAPVAAMAAVAAMIAGVALAGRSLSPGGSPAAARSPSAGHARLSDPADFAGVLQPGGIKMFSPVTGRVVRSVAPFGTTNGFALSPDSAAVYAVGNAGRQIEIRRISVATGKVTFVADGAYPSVGPDSRSLAYAAGSKFTTLAIRELRTGSTRAIDLEPLIGGQSTLLNGGAITWLGDGTQVVVMPEPEAVATADGAAGRRSAGHRQSVGGSGSVGDSGSAGGSGSAGDGRSVSNSCGQQDSPRGLCLIVVDAAGRQLRARRVFVPGPAEPALISGDLAKSRSLLLAISAVSAPVVEEITISGGTASVMRVASLPRDVLPGAFAPAGDRMVYLTTQAGNVRPQLWVARLRNGRLADPHRLFADTGKVSFGDSAW